MQASRGGSVDEVLANVMLFIAREERRESHDGRSKERGAQECSEPLTLVPSLV